MRQTQLKTVREMAESYGFTEPQLRWLIFNAEEFGLLDAIIRIGRRVYIDPEQFDAWINSHRGLLPGERRAS